MKKEKKGNGKKIAIGVAAVVAVAAVAVPTGLMFAGGSKEADASAGNKKYTIVVSTSLDTVADYSLSIEKGTKISTLRTMLKAIDGYDIAGIYKDASLTTEYSDDEYISEDTKIFIKFEALTYTVKVYDENKQNPVEREVNHGEALKLTAPENYSTDFAEYVFAGYYTVVGDNQVDLNCVTSDLEIYPKFEIKQREYSFGYSFGDGNDYSSSIKVSVGGEEKTLNDTYHYGSTIKLRATPKAGYEVSEFKVTVAGQTTDLLTYAYMVIDNGEIYYETELAGNGNITITYSEVAKQAYSIGTIPDGIKVTRNGTTLTNNTEIYFGDELEITIDADYEDKNNSFEIVNAKHAIGNIYYVTGDMTITFEGVYKYAYLNFTQLEDKTYEVSGLNNSDVKSVVIPSTHRGEKVTSIGNSAFAGASGVTSVEIPNEITKIGDNAFEGCSGIQTLTIPENVTYIGKLAFKDCTGLTDLYYNAIETNDFYTISEENGDGELNFTFLNAGNAETGLNVVFGDKVKAVPCGMFFTWNQEGEPTSILKSVTLGKSVKKIGMGAFAFCVNLSTINNLNNVEAIETFAFIYCMNLADVEFSSKLTNVEEQAFFGCLSLKSLNIPGSLTTIGAGAFGGCQGLTSVVISEGITSLVPSMFTDCESLESVSIPSSVTNIGDSAFYNCSNLKEIEIPNSVTIIDDYAFSGCTSLESVKILGENLTSIGNNAFYGCESLISIDMPSSVSSIGTQAFYNCGNLSSIIIPTSLTKIEGSTFYGCSSLKELSIPENVTSIGSGAFENCSGLVSLEIPSNVTNIEYNAFRGCASLTSVTIGNGLTTIGSSAFSDCNNLTQVTIDSASIYKAATGTNNYTLGSLLTNVSTLKVLKTVDDDSNIYIFNNFTRTSEDENYYIYSSGAEQHAYLNFTAVSDGTLVVTGVSDKSITEAIIPDTFRGRKVTSLKEYSFYNCSNLTSVVIGNNITNIGNYSFQNCTNLTSINIPKGVTNIGSLVFSGCSSLTSMSVEEGNEKYTSKDTSGNEVNCIIEKDTKTLLKGCNNSVIPSDGSVTIIGSSAFKDCSDLTSVVIPEGVISIGASAFSDCSKLTSIVIPESVTSIGNYAFNNCSKLTSVTINSKDIYEAALGNEYYQAGGIISYARYIYVPVNIVENYSNSILIGANFAATIDAGYYKFYNINECLYSVEDGIIKGTNVSYINNFRIPDVYSGQKIIGIGDYAFKNKGNIFSVILPQSVTSIGRDAFYGCFNLKSINIPSGVTKIEEYAFYGCSFLNNLVLSEGITSIGRYAFNQCSGLTSINIPSSVTSIDYAAFAGCSKLTTVVIESAAIYELAKGTSSSSVGALLANATEIRVPKEIVDNNTNTYLMGSNFAASLVDGYYTFSPISTYSYLTFRDVTGGLEVAKFDESVTEVVIPSVYGGKRVLGIGECANENPNNAVFGFKNIGSVIISDGIEYIVGYAFASCGSLVSIRLPNTLKEISYNLFELCGKLTSVIIPDSVTSIRDYAFSYCSSLTSVIIPDSVTSISERAFYNCTSLTSVVIPDSVTSIGNHAFSGCSSLTSIEIPSSVTSIGNYAFDGCTSLTSIVIPSNVTSIGKYAFSGCSSLTSIEIPGNVTKIEDYTFYNCSNLSSVVIPEGVTSIGDSAFSGCSSLISVLIPSGVTYIDLGTFNGCNSLTSVEFLYGTDNINIYADTFGVCQNIEMVIIGRSSIYKGVIPGERGPNFNVNLFENVKTIKVLKSIVDDPSNINDNLNNSANYTKTIDGDYYVYTKVEA